MLRPRSTPERAGFQLSNTLVGAAGSAARVRGAPSPGKSRARCRALGWSLVAAAFAAVGCSDSSQLTAPQLRTAGIHASSVATPVTLIFVGNPDSMRRVERALAPAVADASPAGWLYGDASYSSLVGNNAEVVRDTDSYRPHVQDYDFRFPFANSYAGGGDPFVDTDPVEAQAFYWMNVAHDYAWVHGFDEPAGSWQDDRFGRGGPQNHRMIVRLQAGLSNALYVGNGTIVMGLIPYGTLPRRDAGLDVEELVHEYFHAIWQQVFGSELGGTDPWRSVASVLTEAMADYFGATITGDPLFGEYLSRNPATGLDRHRLDDNPQTFSGWSCGEPHQAGEVWSATLWDIRRALGQNAADDRIIRGLVLAERPPTFISIRNGIIRADRVLGGTYGDVLWRIFAARGFGWSSFFDNCSSFGASFDGPPAFGWQLLGVPSEPLVLSGADTSLSVTLRNTSSSTWASDTQVSVASSTEGTPSYGRVTPAVALSYHWLDSAGAVVVYDGIRTALPGPVPPRGSVTLSARVRPPAGPGWYRLQWDLVRGSGSWLGGVGAAYAAQRVVVQTPAPRFATWTRIAAPDSIVAGESAVARIHLVNTGTQTWPASGAAPVRVSYHWADASGKPSGTEGVRSPLPRDVGPGDSVDVDAVIAAPGRYGRYALVWDLLQEGVAWFGWLHSPTPTSTLWVQPRLRAAWVGADPAAARIPPGETTEVAVRIRNVGLDTLQGTGPNAVDIGYHWLDPQGGAAVWDGLRTRLPAPIPPGATADVAVKVARPTRADVPNLAIDMVVVGQYWMSWAGQPSLMIPVRTAPPRWVRWVDVPESLLAVPGRSLEVSVVVMNNGAMPWAAAGSQAVRIGYHLRTSSGEVVDHTGQPVALPRDVAPGQRLSLTATIPAGLQRGDYLVEWDLLDAAAGWFSWFGAPIGVTILKVGPT